jgi:uridylate kinase
MENKMPIIVFNIKTSGNIKRVIMGDDAIGSLVY